MKNITKSILPRNKSKLIRLALSDLELCEKDENYEISMGDWHEPNPFLGVCLVCLAGCVIAKTMKVPKSILTDETGCFNDHNKFSPADVKSLIYLNDVRRNIEYNGLSYHLYPQEFKAKLRDISEIKNIKYKLK